MDILDARIIFQAGFKYHPPYSVSNRRPSPLAISQELGSIDPKKVEERLRKLEDDGFVKHYQAIPNPSALGYRIHTYLLPFPDPLSKGDAVTKLKLLEGIMRIDEYVNSIAFTILFTDERDLQRKLSHARELAGRQGTSETQDQEILLLEETTPPRARMVPSTRRDWQILKSIRFDALKEEQQIAEEVGLSAAATRHHLADLIESSSILIVPILGDPQMSKLTLYALLFIPDLADQKIINQLTDTFKDKSYYRIITASGAIILLMLSSSVADAEANYLKAQKILGIRVVLMDFAGKTQHCLESIDRIIADQLTRLNIQEKNSGQH